MKKWYYSEDLIMIENFLDDIRQPVWEKVVEQRKQYWRSVGMLSEQLIEENAINDASKVYLTLDYIEKKIAKLKAVTLKEEKYRESINHILD
jgi:hypothetical protein